MTLNLSCKRAKGHPEALIPRQFLPSEAPTLSDTRSYISIVTMSAVKAVADALDPSNSSQNTLKIENVRQHYCVVSNILADSVQRLTSGTLSSQKKRDTKSNGKMIALSRQMRHLHPTSLSTQYHPKSYDQNIQNSSVQWHTLT